MITGKPVLVAILFQDGRIYHKWDMLQHPLADHQIPSKPLNSLRADSWTGNQANANTMHCVETKLYYSNG